jgi:ribonuclease D
MQYELIQTSEALSQYCQNVSQSKVLCVDTEFMRVRTYYPQLALIQVYDGQYLGLIDPTKISDLSPLSELLIAPNIVKVMHACSEDLEAILTRMQVMPTPVFDTQVGASLAGMGLSLGYSRLIANELGVEVDKSESRTDWLARPLSPKQCTYAANDVFYLWQVYPKIADALHGQGRYDWILQETSWLAKKKQNLLPAQYSYLGVKNNWKFSGAKLTLLRDLFHWRINTARNNDVALNFVLRESELTQLVYSQPKSPQELLEVRGIPKPAIRRHGDNLLKVINTSLGDRSDPPKPIQRLMDFPNYKSVNKGINELCQEIAEQKDIPISILASKKAINQLLKWLWFDEDETTLSGLKPDLFCAWRYHLVHTGIEKILGKPLTRDSVDQ